MAKAVTEVAIGAAAIGAAILIPGGGIAIGSLLISHAAAVGALVSIAGSEIMAGLADALKSNQGGLAVGVTTPIGPWSYVYGTQKVGGVEIFRESNNATGAGGNTSNDKQLHRVYALSCHPCALGSWQLRIDGKQVLVQPSGSDWVSYSPTQVQYNITSISRTNGVVTMTLSGSMPVGTDGTTLQVRSVRDNSFNGTWTVIQPNPNDRTTFTFVCGGANTSSTGGNARTTYSDYKDKIRVSFLNGNHTSTFPTLLAAGTTWRASDLCLGRTLAYVQMGYDESVFPSSIPNVSFVIDGKNDIYDPRTQTRGFTKNAALCIADFLSLSPTLGGFGLQIGTDIPTAQLIAAANCCDEQVPLNAGGYTPRYTCNTFFQLNMTRGAILKNMLSSCAGRITYQGGQYSIVPGAWVAPTLQLTDGDLVGGIKWNPRFSVRDTCNAVKGTYVSPENAYQQADIPSYMQDVAHGYVSDAWLAEDGNERIFREANFPCTDSSAIAQRLAKIALMRTRFQGRGTIRCSLKAYQAVALDVIQITHPHYTWSSKCFEVLSSKFGVDKSGVAPLPYVDLDIAETDPSIYNWTPTEQLTPQGYMQPNNIGSRVCSPPEAVIAYSGSGGVVNGYTCPNTVTTRTDGTVANSIYVAWMTPNDANVVHGGHMEVQWQPSGASSWTSAGKFDPTITNCSIGGVSDGANYNVQVRAVNVAFVPSDWIQATPYPVTVSTSQTSIDPRKIIHVRPIGGPPPSRLPIGSYPSLDDMMPSEQFADVTGDNTSADTSNVNGVSSTRVKTLSLGSGIAAQDLLTNGNFESGLTGWSQPASVSLETGVGVSYAGTQCAKMAANSSVWQCVQSVGVLAGHTYILQGWVKCDGAMPQGLGLFFHNTANSSDITFLSSTPGTGPVSIPGYPGVQIQAAGAMPWTLLQMVFKANVNKTIDVSFTNMYQTTNTTCGNSWVDSISLIDVTAANSLDAISDGTMYKRVSATNVTAGGGIQYAGGSPIDGLKPSESGANVTNGHVLTAASSPSGEYLVPHVGGIAVPGWGFSAQTANSGDVYNVSATIVVNNVSSPGQLFVLGVAIDGVPLAGSQRNIYVDAGNGFIATISYVMSFTGLAIGSHTINLYATGAPTGVSIYVEPQSYAICQRIF
jgi:hypothetical protein